MNPNAHNDQAVPSPASSAPLPSNDGKKFSWKPVALVTAGALVVGGGCGYLLALPTIHYKQQALDKSEQIRSDAAASAAQDKAAAVKKARAAGKKDAEKEARAAEQAAADDEKAKAAAGLKLGETANLDGGTTVTVYEFNTNAAPSGPKPDSPDDKWAAADIQTCMDADGYISSMPWTVIDSENRNFTPSSVGYDSFPEPSYAWGDETMSAGDCRRGWLVFTVNADAKLKTISYNGDSGTAKWKLGK